MFFVSPNRLPGITDSTVDPETSDTLFTFLTSGFRHLGYTFLSRTNKFVIQIGISPNPRAANRQQIGTVKGYQKN